MIQKQQLDKSTPQTVLPDLRPTVVPKDRQVVDTTTDPSVKFCRPTRSFHSRGSLIANKGETNCQIQK
jgi:hypothetical protein